MLRDKILSRIYMMQHTTRYNNLPVRNRQNIAEHSNGVSLLCLLIGKEIEDRFRFLKIPISLDYRYVSVWANFHDYEETVSTDFPYPLKIRLGKEIMSQVDSIISQEIFEDYEAFGFSKSKLDEEKKSRSEKWQLLKICDYLELLLWTYNNKNQMPESNYWEVVKKCKELISSYEIYKYSNTILEILESDEFTFSY